MNVPSEPSSQTENRTPRSEPIFNLPSVIVWLLGLLASIHLARMAVAQETDWSILSEFAVVPARFALELGWLDQQAIVRQLLSGASGEERAALLTAARFFIDGEGPRWWSLATYGLLHAGSAHIIMNCLWLTVFGSPVARRIGAGPFLALLAAGTVAGAATHIGLHPWDVAPLVGASAAVSAATGAASRFVFSGGVRLGEMGDDAAARALPALSLAGLARNRQSLLFVGLWFLTNWLFGSGVVNVGGDGQSIAWEAHVGGFVAGLLLFPLLDRRAARP